MKEPRTALLGGLATALREEKCSQATWISFISSLSLFNLLKKSFNSFSSKSLLVTYWSFVTPSTWINKIAAHGSRRNSNSLEYGIVRARDFVLYHLVTLVLQA